MQKKIRWIRVLILIFVASFGIIHIAGKSHAQDAGEWSVFSSGTPSKEKIECSGFSSSNWRVEKEIGGIQITKSLSRDLSIENLPFRFNSKNISSHQRVSAISKAGEFWLLGLDGGEWGGGLWWVSPDGGQGQLLDMNVRSILETKNGPLVFVGLNHENKKSGEVFLVRPDKTGLIVASIAKLKGVPSASILTLDKEVLMISENNLIQMTLDGKMRKIAKLPLYYPNSMAQDNDGSIWIGGRHFVVRIICQNGGMKEEWYVPDNCKDFKMKEGRCVCGG